MRSASQVVGVSIKTVSKLLVDAGEACVAYYNEHVRGISAGSIRAGFGLSLVGAVRY